MTAADVPFAMELKNLAGWNQTSSDWLGYLEFEAEGCFVAEVNGRAVGTSTAIGYGDRLGWIGMVLVHPEARGRGVGTRLLRHAIEYLRRRGTACVKLDATPMGKKVYVPLGFQEEFELARWAGSAPEIANESDPHLRLLGERDLDELVAFDAHAFGVVRTNVLRALCQRNPAWCFVQRDASGIAGYLIAREGHQAVQLGPWLAADRETADRLLRAFFATVGGRRVFVDVPQPNEVGGALLRRYGFLVQRGFTRMHLGPNLHPGVPQRIFGCSGAEKG